MGQHIHLDDRVAVIEFLHRTGHLKYPFGSAGQDLPSELWALDPEDKDYDKKIRPAVVSSRLSLRDSAVTEAIRSHQSFDVQYEPVSMMVHNRELIPDGDPGPATELLMNAPRCGHPDYRPSDRTLAAVGSGNWPRCHGVGDYHSVSIQVLNSPPSFLTPHFELVKERCTQAYAEIGLLLRWDAPKPVNIDFSFVNSSSGWIGLAIVGQNESCNSKIWCKYLATYRGGSTDEAIITQWTTLIKHELGHNCGMSHFRGGVMNPSIVNGLPVSWKGDPAHSFLTSRYGGVPVPRTPDEQREMWLCWKQGEQYEPISRVPIPDVSSGPFPDFSQQ